jgi:4-hydroxy-4-methyl-2-oxoglutarate aldolase
MKTLTPGHLEDLRSIETCVLASAIETFHVRLPNIGFSNSSIHCMFRERPPIAGYAATARIRSARPPIGGHSYYDHTEWWNHILSIPPPRVVAIEDVDDPPGLGAFVGQVNAAILVALGCTAVVTNGAVRDLREVHSSGFQMFAGNVSVSHAYAHVLEFGGAVEVGGMTIRPGDLLHGDTHGVLAVPLEVAADVPVVAREIIDRRQRLVDLCHSADFSIDKLRRTIQETDLKR